MIAISIDKRKKIDFINISIEKNIEIFHENNNLTQMSKQDLLSYLRAQNSNEMILTENNHSVTFMNISLGIYYEMTEEEVQELIRESKEDGVYDEMREDIEVDIEKSKKPSVFGIGIKDYYRECYS